MIHPTVRKAATITLALAAAALFLMPDLAHASVTAAGGGMPYSTGLGTLNSSIRTEVAGVLIVICIVCGVIGYIIAGQMEGLMMVIGRCMIGISIVGGVVSFAAIAGVTGALV